jgi:hypothetical protein
MTTDQPDDALNTHLTAAYTALIIDFAHVLDLDAGATEATLPATYTSLVHDLADTFDP